MQVEVLFTGLCAFVKNPSAIHMRVVLISPGAAPCDVHEPALLVPIVHWDQTLNQTRIPSETFFDRDFGGDVVVLPLAGEDLVFPAGTTAFGFDPSRRLGTCPGIKDQHSFDWIASIGEVTGNGSMTDAVLTSPSPGGVAARIRMASGIFSSTNRFRTDFDQATGKSYVVKFRFPKAHVERALSEEILWQDNVVSTNGILQIASVLFGGGAGSDIKLRQNTFSRVEFKVVDLPLEKIKNPSSANPLAQDDCFAEFYDLGAGKGEIPMPFLDPSCPPPTGGLSNPRCPCAVFSDNANA